MKKEYILTFCISFLILATVVVILLMILLPQQTTVTVNSIEDYSSIKKSEYTFKQTNGLTFDNLVREYVITDTQLKTFKDNRQYTTGKSDPFSDNTVATGNETSTTTKTTSSNTTTKTTTDTATTDKITNSNNGIANPASTNK